MPILLSFIIKSKFLWHSSGDLGKWSTPTKRADAVELENNTGEVAKYLVDTVNKVLGIVEVKKMSVMDRIALTRKSA